MSNSILLSEFKAVTIGDNANDALAYRENHPRMYVYTHGVNGNQNYLCYGVVIANVPRYVALDRYIGEYVELTNDTPAPFSDMDESDATTICEIARWVLNYDILDRLRIGKELDLSDDELDRLQGILQKALGA